jgi:hypothetical protein
MAAEPALKGTNLAEKIEEVKVMVKRKYGSRVRPGPLSCIMILPVKGGPSDDKMTVTLTVS